MVSDELEGFPLSLEAVHGSFACGAMGPHIRDLPHPPHQVAAKGLPAWPGKPPQGIAFGVTHASFHLALGSGPIGAAGSGFHAPVEAEGFELGMKFRAVTLPAEDQGFGVVHHTFLGHTPEMAQRSLQALQPVTLPKGGIDLGEGSSAIPQRCHEHERLHPLPGHLDPLLAEVDLHLMARVRLESEGGPILVQRLVPERRYEPFHRAQAHLNATVRQFLPQHVCVPHPGQEPRPQPILVAHQG
jgi:hypothetical protein